MLDERGSKMDSDIADRKQSAMYACACSLAVLVASNTGHNADHALAISRIHNLAEIDDNFRRFLNILNITQEPPAGTPCLQAGEDVSASGVAAPCVPAGRCGDRDR